MVSSRLSRAAVQVVCGFLFVAISSLPRCADAAPAGAHLMAAAAGPRAPGRRCRVPALRMPPRKGTGGPAHRPIVHDFFDLRYTNREGESGIWQGGGGAEVAGAGRGVLDPGSARASGHGA